MKPLAKEAVGLEPLGGDLEEVLREEIGNTCDPGIRRFRDDNVVSRFAALQLVSRVAENELDALVLERLPIQGLEETRRFDDRRLDLERVDTLHWVPQHSADGHAASPADHADPLRVLQKKRKMAEKKLRRDVTRPVRSVRLAVDLQKTKALDLLLSLP